MAKINILPALTLVILLLFISACSDPAGKQQETVFKQRPEIAEIKPDKTVKIKLKRGGDGDYSWELSGDDADKVLQVDRQLKESLGKQNTK
ncbi:MAG: hypothetical protein HZC49_11090 [Nitrospirae bacterium]|nr:hypothetical protein [Nitrospirota bacterium]